MSDKNFQNYLQHALIGSGESIAVQHASQVLVTYNNSRKNRVLATFRPSKFGPKNG
jgi:hypothetical protein